MTILTKAEAAPTETRCPDWCRYQNCFEVPEDSINDHSHHSVTLAAQCPVDFNELTDLDVGVGCLEHGGWHQKDVIGVAAEPDDRATYRAHLCMDVAQVDRLVYLLQQYKRFLSD